MKLLMENWRKFVNEEEGEQFPPNDDYENSYFPWLNHISPLDSSKFDRVGGGTYREVYSPKSDSEDFVVKIATNRRGRIEEGRDMNEIEFEASRKFPNVFPKAYSHADDWSWVVTERITILKPDDVHWDELIVVNFPDIKEFISKGKFVYNGEEKSIKNVLLGADIFVVQNELSSEGVFFHITQALMQGGSGDSSRYKTGWSKKMADQYLGSETKDVEKAAYQIIFDYGMKSENDPIFNELYRAYTDLKLEPSDWGAGNIGIDKMSNLKIADASPYFEM